MIQFRVLGSLHLRGPEGAEVLSVLSQPKRAAILAYLAVASPGGFHRRDKIAGLFWPESDQERARARLRGAVHHLRQSLGESAILSRGDEEIGLNWEQVTCDAVEFREALDGGDVEKGLELYAGDLLEGFFLSGYSEFERWLVGERERLKDMAAVASWELAHRHLQAGRITDGERMGKKALGLVPTDENEVQRFIRALDDAGNRAAAVRFYERFARELKENLDLRPSAGTRALAEEIRNTMGHPIPPEGRMAPPEEGVAAEGAAPPRPSRLLQRVRDALADRYSVQNEIGGGSLATVFLAQDLRHERNVALKVLAPELAETLGAERFVREIKTAANLTHPHILPVFDAGEAEGLFFYVMPYVKGESLRTRLTKEKQLPVEDAVQITREIADALAYAHEEGVIHRDVKPANIMLEAGHAVLADFGVAHAVADTRENRITGVGTPLGTPAYISPEQITGERDLDGRSDQYGLGCVLYEMLAGEPPFTGPTAESVTRQHLSAEPPLVTQMRPSVGDGVARVIQRALSKNPADRFRTTGEMAAALALTTVPATVETLKGAKSLRIALGVAVLVVIGFLGTVVLRPGEEAPSDSAVVAEDDRPGIAVLPCENISPNPEDAFRAQGIHEEILVRLQGISSLRSVGRSSVLRFAEDPAGVSEVASALRVGFIGGCSVMKDPARTQIRVTFRLLDAGGVQLWAEIYDRDLTVENIFDIQSDIAQRVANSVGAVVTAAESGRMGSVPTHNLPAYEAYVKGNLQLRELTELEESVRFFQRSIEMEPNWAAPYAGLAQTYALMGSWWGGLAPMEAVRLAEPVVSRALQLDPSLPDAYFARGLMSYLLEYDWAGAETAFTQAADLGWPASSRWIHANYLTHMGRFEESISLLEEMLEADPLDPTLHNELFWALRMAGRSGEALERIRASLRLDPDLLQTQAMLMLAYLDRGMPDSAVAKAHEMPISNSSVASYAGYVFGITGERAEALEILESLRR